MRIFSIFLFLVFHFSIFAQTRIISGLVTDESGEPLIYASIICKGTDRATNTDIDGRFQIEVADEKVTLIISYTGYETLEKIIKKPDNKVVIKMREGVSLEESVVTGMSKKRTKMSRSKGRRDMVSTAYDVRRPTPVAESKSMPTSSSTAYVSGAIAFNDIAAGTLTAGEIHDFSKWKLWEDIAADKLKEWQLHWKINPSERYAVQLTTENNSAVIDAIVKLVDEKGQAVWTTRSDNTGKAELWANLFEGKSNKQRYSIEATYEGETYTIKRASVFHNGINTLKLPIPCYQSSAVDIAFVVDATGSMSDEIEYLKVEMNNIIGKVRDTLPDLDINLGTVFYRDEGEEYITRKSPFSKAVEETTSFIKQQSANGGGDFPEAVDAALEVAINDMNWREEALGRFLFLVLDAPPHHNPEVLEKLRQLAMTAAEKGIRIIPITGSGIDKSTEYLMRTFALLTNGSYVFLTDHSGVGNPHIEPTTDSYDVELLNDLLVRLIYQYTYVPKCDDEDLLALDAPPQVVLDDKKNKVFEDTKVSWKYFPNPTSGQLNVQLKGKLEHLFLTDYAGKILERYALVENGNLDLHLGNYPSGIYFLKAFNRDQSLSGKVILAR
ncbi:MAG: carboxypeptidase-like regulatory domain-containing protein [Bacteroidota bacterium]